MWQTDVFLVILLLLAVSCFVRSEAFDNVRMVWKKDMNPPYTTVVGNTMHLFNPELYNS